MWLVGLLQVGGLGFVEFDVHRGDGVGQLGRLGDADDGRGHGRVAHDPGQGDLGGGEAPLVRDLVDAVGYCLVLVAVEDLVARVGPGTRRGGVPGPRQPAPRQRAPRDHADALVGAEREHLPLGFSVDEVVVVLHRYEPGPAVQVGQVQGLGELPGVHGRGSDVADLPGLDRVVQRLKGFLDGGVVVPAVDLVEVDVVGAQSLQGGVELGEDRLAGQPGAVRAGAHPHPDLGGENDLVAPGEVLDRLADDLLAASGAVSIGRVEEVDAGLKGLLDDVPAGVRAQ